MRVVDVLSGGLLLAGASLNLIAAIGMHRFPDFFARMHAASKPVTLGLLLVLAGTALEVGAGVAGVLILVGALQLVTAPVGAHVLARAAYRSGDQLSPATCVDELADARRGAPGPGAPGAEPPA